MREIASRGGVSPITVSRALKTPDKVSPETRQRILEVIEREGFIPSQVASSMRGAGRIIGTMVPPLINSGIAEQVQGMSDECQESGYQLLLIQGDFAARGGGEGGARAARLAAGRADPAGLRPGRYDPADPDRQRHPGRRDQRDPRQEADRHGGRHFQFRDRLCHDRPSRGQGLHARSRSSRRRSTATTACSSGASAIARR